MPDSLVTLNSRRNVLAFWLGCAIVTLGVVLHIPMFLMGQHSGFVLAGMPMDAEMYWGMALIVGGILLTGYGLLPNPPATEGPTLDISAPEDAPLTTAHWWTAGLLGVALIIDIMKPATLGFVTPGMQREYGVSHETVAWLPFAALIGTALGSFIWGALADLYGRRASILLSSVMFIGTSICGAMPDFWWNVFMCLLMGMAAGGMLPVTYALLAEIMPTRHRGWFLVLIGGIGAVGGYFAASGLSALLQPTFGWRIMWFLNLPTGLILIAVSPLLPESIRFLQHMGRGAEARAELARFGLAAVPAIPIRHAGHTAGEHSPLPPTNPKYLGVTTALTVVALVWGLVNFGLLLWIPGVLVDEGRSVAAASALIARSTLIAAPTVLACTLLYSRWSTKRSLLLMLGMITLGLLGFLLRSSGVALFADPVIALSLIIIGTCGSISVLLPYTAETYPLRYRGRATGWVAGCSKSGGLLAQGVSVAGLAPGVGTAGGLFALLAVAGALLVWVYGRETRGYDLRDLERHRHASAPRRKIAPE